MIARIESADFRDSGPEVHYAVDGSNAAVYIKTRAPLQVEPAAVFSGQRSSIGVANTPVPADLFRLVSLGPRGLVVDAFRPLA